MDATELARKVEVFIQQYMPPEENVLNSNERHGIEPSYRIEHSIDNAIILMVLALGAICEHKTTLPSFAPDLDERSHAKQRFAVPAVVKEIPGLAYYTCAAGILGERQGGSELSFVQASILASFYAGQLAHPIQSHGWISQAARACSLLMRL